MRQWRSNRFDDLVCKDRSGVFFLQSNKLAMIDRLFTQAAARAAPKRFQDMIIARRSSTAVTRSRPSSTPRAQRGGAVGVGRSRWQSEMKMP